MKALAWDDKPQNYLESLKKRLLKYNIILEFEVDPDRFKERFAQDKWDFVVLDYLDESPKEKGTIVQGREEGLGAILAREISIRNPIPIFIITAHIDRLALEASNLPINVSIHSKNTSTAWMAGDIVTILKKEGLYSNPKEVFLIYGHDVNAKNATQSVRDFLKKEMGLNVVEITSTNLESEIAQGLVTKMKNCRAIVAVCTPDDEWKSGEFHPRLNVILEIGIAMGLTGGINKLCVLQRWGSSNELQAKLPSDLGGLLTTRFEDDVQVCFDDLRHRLYRLNIKS